MDRYPLRALPGLVDGPISKLVSWTGDGARQPPNLVYGGTIRGIISLIPRRSREVVDRDDLPDSVTRLIMPKADDDEI